MATDHSLALRKAVVAALAADTRIASTSAVVHGEEPPANAPFPFIRYGLPILVPTEASGWVGETTRVTIHAFANGPGMNKASRIGKLIAMALDDQPLRLAPDEDTGKTADVVELFHVGTQVIRDTDEASAYHAIVEFEAVVAEAT